MLSIKLVVGHYTHKLCSMIVKTKNSKFPPSYLIFLMHLFSIVSQEDKDGEGSIYKLHHQNSTPQFSNLVRIYITRLIPNIYRHVLSCIIKGINKISFRIYLIVSTICNGNWINNQFHARKFSQWYILESIFFTYLYYFIFSPIFLYFNPLKKFL